VTGRFLIPLALVAASLAPGLAPGLAPSAASAKGGSLHLFVPHAAASPLAHGVSASDLLAGCGRGRYRDRATQSGRRQKLSAQGNPPAPKSCRSGHGDCNANHPQLPQLQKARSTS
jgi:hypothetical protein